MKVGEIWESSIDEVEIRKIKAGKIYNREKDCMITDEMIEYEILTGKKKGKIQLLPRTYFIGCFHKKPL
jgi:hypothetical protein